MTNDLLEGFLLAVEMQNAERRQEARVRRQLRKRGLHLHRQSSGFHIAERDTRSSVAGPMSLDAVAAWISGRAAG